MKLQACVVRFEGTNREGDLLSALRQFSEIQVEIVESNKPRFSSHYDLIFLCGGFAWGDYVRAGAIAARTPVMRAVEKCAAEGAIIVGICNGFQILTEAGWLPGALMRNKTGRFVCRWQMLSIAAGGLTHQQQRWCLPIAHSDGRYIAEPEVLAQLQREQRILMRYEDDNPNGSMERIAAICDNTRRIIGLMPHPENAVAPFHASQDGELFFRSVLRCAQTAAQRFSMHGQAPSVRIRESA